MVIWWNETQNSGISQVLLEPENEFEKFVVSVKKCDVVIGHLWKRKTSWFAKTISFFLRGSHENSCKDEVILSETW